MCYYVCMNIQVTTISHTEQRYATTGDWWFDDNGDLQVRISNVEDTESEALVALHEIVEALLCRHRGISEESVTEFDTTHPELEDPGSSPLAPYHKEHTSATAIELSVCKELDMGWEDHNERLEALYKSSDNTELS